MTTYTIDINNGIIHDSSNKNCGCWDCNHDRELIADHIKFIKGCLRDKATTSPLRPEVISLVLKTYDLESFIKTWTGNKFELATHFIKHVRAVQDALDFF